MNSNLGDFIKGIGLMVEFWVVTYNSFIKTGLSESDAMKHTKAFMELVINSNLSKQEGGSTE